MRGGVTSCSPFGRDVGTISELVGKTYKLQRRQAEVSVSTFLQTLVRKGLIGFFSMEGRRDVKRKP